MTDGLRCRVLHPEALSDTDRQAWSALAHSAMRHGGAFLTWQYAVAVGRVVSSARVAAIEDAAGRRAYLAFQAKPGLIGRFGVYERIGGGLSDYAGLVAEPGFSTDAATLLEELRRRGIATVAADPRAEIDPARCGLTSPVALWIGGEGGGLPREILDAADRAVRIPMADGVESLAAPAAAAVLLYEAARQRGSWTAPPDRG